MAGGGCWEQGPPPLSRGPVSYQVSGGIILEIKHTIKMMCLNLPEAVPLPLVRGKIVSHEIGP